MDAISVVSSRDELGESVLWMAASSTVYWIDGFSPVVHRYSPAKQTHEAQPLRLPAPVGMIACTVDVNVLITTCRDGVALHNVATGETVEVAQPEGERSGIGYNDGKVDADGRLWVGTYDMHGHEPRGCLWVLENARAPKLVDSGFAVTNGPAFSPDGRVIFLSDSIARRIIAYDVSGVTLSSRRIFAVFTADEGCPDGLTVDAEGCLWCAHWGGSRVTRFAPSGERLMTVGVPASLVTSVAFGGTDFATLFVTTARYELGPAELASSPESGNLFAVRPGIAGLPPTPLPLPFNCNT